VGRSSHDAVASQLDRDNTLVGIRYSGATWAEVMSGYPLGSTGAGWASAAAGRSWFGSAFSSLGLAGAGQLYAFGGDSASSRELDWGAVAELGPVLLVPGKPFDLEVRPAMIATYGETEREPANPVLRWSFSGWATLRAPLASSVQVQVLGRYVHTDGAGFGLTGLGATYDASAGGAWGRVGRWISSSLSDTEWATGAYLNVSDRLQIHGSVYRDADDPIYLTAARYTYTMGGSFALDRRDATFGSVPLEMSGEQVVIRVPRSVVPDQPSIAGDFTDWTPRPMEAEGDEWVARFTAVPGLYRYTFVDARGIWFLPSSVTNRVPDSFGGENGVILVQ
jgi:hypothetical protein